VVQYVIDTFSAGRDLNDPKEKAALSRQVTPFIRDVADPVERAAYVQRLARLLKVDERAVADQLGLTTASATRRGRASRPAEPPPSPTREAIDRERYCLVELLRAPHALPAIDETLSRADLPPFDMEDFGNIAHREVFAVLQSTTAARQIPSIDDVLDQLDPALRGDAQSWLESSAPRPAIDKGIDETRGIVDAALMLRERNLKAYGSQLEELIRSASEEDNADAMIDLSQAKRSLSDQLNRLSRIRYAPEVARQAHSDSRR
jgi:DNA primase